jgi:serine/threonine protein phosphatase PrpC
LTIDADSTGKGFKLIVATSAALGNQDPSTQVYRPCNIAFTSSTSEVDFNGYATAANFYFSGSNNGLVKVNGTMVLAPNGRAVSAVNMQVAGSLILVNRAPVRFCNHAWLNIAPGGYMNISGNGSTVLSAGPVSIPLGQQYGPGGILENWGTIYFSNRGVSSSTIDMAVLTHGTLNDVGGFLYLQSLTNDGTINLNANGGGIWARGGSYIQRGGLLNVESQFTTIHGLGSQILGGVVQITSLSFGRLTFDEGVDFNGGTYICRYNSNAGGFGNADKIISGVVFHARGQATLQMVATPLAGVQGVQSWQVVYDAVNSFPIIFPNLVGAGLVQRVSPLIPTGQYLTVDRQPGNPQVNNMIVPDGFVLRSFSNIAATLTGQGNLTQDGGNVTVGSTGSLNVSGTYTLASGSVTEQVGGSMSVAAYSQSGGLAAIAGSVSTGGVQLANGTLHALRTSSITGSSGFTVSATGALEIELASLNALINAAGPISLQGNLVLDVASGFSPSSTAVITLIHNTGSGSVSGVFAGLNEGATAVTIGGTAFNIFYNGGTDGRDVVLEAGNPFTGTSTSPVANNISVSPHGAAVTINVLAHDYDPDGDSLTVTAAGSPAHGTAVVNANNTITYTPTSGSGASIDSFTYTISDGSSIATGTVNVFLTELLPIANDFLTAHVSGATTLNVLANDYDPDADSLTITAVGRPAHGTATINSGSTITYTPSSGLTTGTDTFTYTVSDGHGATAVATIALLIGNQAPFAKDASIGHATAAVTVNVLANDFDSEGDTLTVTSVGAAAHGTATINPNNTITYTPNAGVTTGVDWFTYTISDGHGGTSSATVSVFISNQPPVANTVAVVHATAAVTVNVLAADWDPDNDALTVTAVGTPAHGTAAINANNTITYTPASGVTAATDSFSYTISDGHGGTSTATVVVYLADRAPVAVNASATPHGAPVTINVLGNDSDPDGDNLTVTAVGTPAHGTAVINADNTITYTPTSGTTYATDKFTYTISDGYGGTSTATVYIYLTEQAPVATNASASPHSAAVTINVLANDFDPDGDTLTVTAVGTPAHGTAVINADNSITYTPTAGTTASTDSFTYTISDGHGGTSTATVYLYLADRPPIAANASAAAHSAAVTINVLANDSDPDGDNLTVTAVGTPAHGTAVINPDNTITYTPTAGTTVSTDRFTYTISDGYGGTSTATVYLYLTDRPPVATNASAVAHSAAVTINVLANDSSPDGDALTVTAVGSPAHGTAVVNGNYTITYTPTAGTTAGTDKFTYTISDGYGGTSTGTVYVYLTDRAPLAVNTSAVAHSAAVTINVLANDSGPDGDNLTVTAVGTPAHGTAVINADNTITYTPTAGTTASTDSFTYTISDGYGGTSTATVYLYLTDRPPLATNASAVAHSAAVTINVLANDSSPDGDTLTVTAVGTPAHGTAVINADNTITYTPTAGTTVSTDSFTYTISDGYGGSSTATVVVYLTDRPPVALNASAAVHGARVTISVLANDSSPDGDNLTVTAVGTPAHGTAAINADNTITYTPTAGTTASTDSFTYTISDGYGGTSTGTVYLYLTDRVPVAVNTSAVAHSAAVTINVLANDSSPDGDTLTVTAVGTPAHGTAVINADNTIMYTPTAGTTASTDSFTYTISDGYGGTATATVYLYLTDRPPTAANATAVAHSAAVTVNVLANDSSPDGDVLTVTAVGAAAHGTAVINADNTITYTPTAGTTASTDSFTYTISDGYGGTSTGTVYVYLADRAPVAVNTSAVAHSAAVTINVLANDFSPDGDILTVTAVGTAAHGTAVINADNTITYTPTAGTTYATDKFTYTISDGYGGTSTATVYLYLTDRPPVATNASAVAHSAAVTINVLANDSSPDGDALTVTAVGSPAHGTAVINADSTITYTPTAGTTLSSDTFTYTISDGYGGTATATVTVYLTDRAPVAVNASATTHGAAVTINVLANDSSPDGDTLTVTAVGTPAHGTAVLNADNTVTYTPTAGTTASTDTFTYTISDGYGGTATSTITVNLVDQAPVAIAASASAHGNPVTINVLVNDSDPDGDNLTVTTVGTPAHGIAVINADNTITYTPTAGTTASTDAFTYTISDGYGGTASATITIHLADQAPVANNASASPHGNPVTINVLANDSDPDGDNLTVTAVGTPSHGTAVINADNTITYTPSAGTTATTDNFTYTIADGYGGTASATVTIYLTDRAPTAVNDVAAMHGGTSAVINVLANDSSPDGDILTVTSVGTPAHGTAVLNADNTVTYTPTAGTTATTDTFTYTISDGYGGTATATVKVYLTNPGPIANEVDVIATTAAVVISVLVNDYNPDGDALTVTSIGTPGAGSATLNADGTITYTPPGGMFTGFETFTYTVSDGYGGTSTATVHVNVDYPPPGPLSAVSVYDQTSTSAAVVINVLANVYNPNGYALTVTAIGSPLAGTATLNSDGTVTYTPTPGTTWPSDSFTYTISDGHGDTSTATISITLAS